MVFIFTSALSPYGHDKRLIHIFEYTCIILPWRQVPGQVALSPAAVQECSVYSVQDGLPATVIMGHSQQTSDYTGSW